MEYMSSRVEVDLSILNLPASDFLTRALNIYLLNHTVLDGYKYALYPFFLEDNTPIEIEHVSREKTLYQQDNVQSI